MKTKAAVVIIAVCFALIILSPIIYGLLQQQITIPGQGKIKGLNVKVYSDSACTVELTQIDWGLLEPGQSKTVTCHLKSTSTVNATLSMTTGSWNPSSASGYISLSWNREAYRIKPSEVVSATLTLTISQSITGISSFTFTITIVAAEAT